MPVESSSKLFCLSLKLLKNAKHIIILLGLLTLTATLVSHRSLISQSRNRSPKSQLSQGSLSKELINKSDNSLDTVLADYTLRYNRMPPKRFTKWFEFAESKKCFTDIVMYESIYKDLAPFFELGQEDYKKRLQLLLRSASSYRALDVLKISGGSASGGPTARVQSFATFLPDMTVVFNGLDEPRVLYSLTKSQLLPLNDSHTPQPLFVSPPRGQHEAFLQKHCIVRSEKRPWNTSAGRLHGFMIQPDSSSYTSELLPILSQAVVEGCFADIRYPTSYYTQAQSKGLIGHLKWEDRKSKMYWRGSTTGGHAISNNFERFHRERVNALAQASSDVFDVAFTAAIQCDPGECEVLRSTYRFDSRAPMERNFEHKYLLDVDGNTFSGRFFSFLYSGSLVFKATIFKEHFERWLKPYEHYIPIEMDFSDLEDKVKWAMRHDAEAKRMAENAKAFALEHLHDDQADCYLFLLLLELARLQGSE